MTILQSLRGASECTRFVVGQPFAVEATALRESSRRSQLMVGFQLAMFWSPKLVLTNVWSAPPLQVTLRGDGEHGCGNVSGLFVEPVGSWP